MSSRATGWAPCDIQVPLLGRLKKQFDVRSPEDNVPIPGERHHANFQIDTLGARPGPAGQCRRKEHAVRSDALSRPDWGSAKLTLTQQTGPR